MVARNMQRSWNKYTKKYGAPSWLHSKKIIQGCTVKKKDNIITMYVNAKYDKVTCEFIWEEIMHFRNLCNKWWRTCCSKRRFFGKLNEVIVEIGNSREILIAGDFNSWTGEKINNLVVGPFGEEVINANGDKLIDICEQNWLKILNGYSKHKRIHQYSWHQDTKELRSIIDTLLPDKILV